MANLKKVDVGLQIGGQSAIEVIFFETEEALNRFKQGEFEFSAEATAIALEKGIASNANYEDGVVVFVKPKEGLMADLSVGGQKFGYTAMENVEN
jgi:lipid-binding SYLF domain-containing protein